MLPIARIAGNVDGGIAVRRGGVPGVMLHVFSERFLPTLAEAQRAAFEWRLVEIEKPSRKRYFELVGAHVRASPTVARSQKKCGFLQHFSARSSSSGR